MARLAVHGDGAFMIAHHRLHDGQPQPGAVLLGGVVGREQALAFFGRQAFAGVRDLDAAIFAAS